MSKLPEVKDYIHDESVSTDFVDDREVSSFKVPDLLFEPKAVDSDVSTPDLSSEIKNQVPDLKIPESKNIDSTDIDFGKSEIPEISEPSDSHFQFPDLKELPQPEIGNKEIPVEKSNEWFSQPRSFNPAIEQAKDFILSEMSFFGNKEQSSNTSELERSSMQIEGVPSLRMEGEKPEFADQEESSSVDEQLKKSIQDLSESIKELIKVNSESNRSSPVRQFRNPDFLTPIKPIVTNRP